MSESFDPSHDQFTFPPRGWTLGDSVTMKRVLLGTDGRQAFPLFTDEDLITRYLSETDKASHVGELLPSNGHILLALESAQSEGATHVVFDPSGPLCEHPFRPRVYPIAYVIRVITG